MPVSMLLVRQHNFRCFFSRGAAACGICRDFIVATWLREQTMGMLMWKAKPPWIALRARSFQLHNQLLGFLVIAKDVQQGMIHGRRDFRTRISSSIDSLPPGTSAGKRNRLLMRHLLPDDVQLHSSLLLKSGFLLGKQCQYSFLFCFGARSIRCTY